ncbi:MAG: tetratricopeptide repeat protein [Bacteroidales bacterium]|nr:tetratricopeptide repeat protein [Bacteroidales bacterium]
MNKKKILYNYSKLFYFIVIVFLFSCSTKKNTTISRAYHNLTAHYNVFFNANESFKKGQKKINDNFHDNYSDIIPLYKCGDNKVSKSIYPQMNKTIEKASKTIKKHSITTKPKRKKNQLSKSQRDFFNKKEYCNWIDDSYIIMGQSHFYKRDFYPAIETFNYVIQQFNDEPVRYEGLLWLTRTYCEMNNFKKAKKLINVIEGEENKLPKKLKKDFYAVYADFFLKQEKYQEAIPKLLKAIDYNKKKKIIVRYKYLLAQIYQKIEDNDNASKYFNEVIKLNPEYEMAFNAKINLAILYDTSFDYDKNIEKQLFKMLKDDKNIDYQDQIYFALANIAFKENVIDQAIDYYKLSAQKSVSNTNQKAISFLSIADIYFEQTKYTLAQAYYDSTVTFLDKTYPEYEKISSKTRYLTELVKNLQTVQLQDSLQKLAKMTEKERLAVIDKIIENVKKEEELKKQDDEQEKLNSGFLNQNTRNNNTSNIGGKWYFYNPNALSMGHSEFIQKWGRRKLEDDWRRKNKASVDFNQTAGSEGSEQSNENNQKQLSNKTREFYLKDIPASDSAINNSNKQIQEALFNIANVYQDKLHDYNQAINVYESLIKKFPENDFLLLTYYRLYSLNKDLNNIEKTDYYKNLIIKNFPESNYAKVLINPSFFKELQKKQNQINLIYSATYKYYQNKQFDKVMYNFHYVDTTYKNNNLMSKFEMLKTLSVGKQKDTTTFKTELINYIKKYPNCDETKYATSILASLTHKKEMPATTDSVTVISVDAFESEQDSTEKEIYSIDNKAVHFYVIVIDSKKIDVNELKFNMSNFNIDYYSYINFNISNMILNTNFQLVVVKRFKNKDQGINYYESIIANDDVFKDIKPSDYRYFIISIENFKIFYQDKSIKKYLKFFNENYIKEE